MPAGEFLIPELTGKEGTMKFSKDLRNMLSLSSAPEVAIQQNLTLPKKGVKRSAGFLTPEEHVVGRPAKILKGLKCYLVAVNNKERVQQIEKGLDALTQQIKSLQDQVELLKKEKAALLKEESKGKKREKQKKRDLGKQVSPSMPKNISSANARESTEIKSVKCVSAEPWSSHIKQQPSMATNKDKLVLLINKKPKLQNSNIKTNKIHSERIPHLKKKPKQPDSDVTKPEKRLPSAEPSDGSRSSSSASSTYSSHSGRGSSHHPEHKSNKATLCNASTNVNKIKTVATKQSFPAKQKTQPLPGCSGRAQPVSASHSNRTSVQKKRPAKMLADRHVPPPKGFPPMLPLLPSGTGLPTKVAEPGRRSESDKHEQGPKLSHAQNPGTTGNSSSLHNASGQHFSNQSQQCKSTPDVKANGANSKRLVRNTGSWAELTKMTSIAPVIPSSHDLFQKFQKYAVEKKEQEKKFRGVHETRDSHQSSVTQQLTKAKPDPGKLPLAPAVLEASAPPRHAPKTFSQPTVGPKVSAPPAPLRKTCGHNRELDRKREQERRRKQPMSLIYYVNVQKEIMETFEKTHFAHFNDLCFSKEGSEQPVDLLPSSSSSVGSIF